MKSLKEVFALIESNGWHICTLEESPERFKDDVTVYGFSKPVDDDVICFTVILAKTETVKNKDFIPTAENLADWINAVWNGDCEEWERPEIYSLENAVRAFISE